MEYKPTTCTSLINKITKKDTLFQGKYTLDPYQYCEYRCLYCDSSTDKTVFVKANAVDLFKKEISKLKKDVIIIGSVHDPYQKAEENYQITRDILKIILKDDFPCHILTKSPLILRDLDILSKIENCTITISLISLNKKVTKIFEKSVPSPIERLQTVKKLSDNGITTGVALIPILPYIIESELENIVKLASDHNASYLIHKYLELKGDQRIKIQKILIKHYPHYLKKYEKLYGDQPKPNHQYILEMDKKIKQYCKNFGISTRI